MNSINPSLAGRFPDTPFRTQMYEGGNLMAVLSETDQVDKFTIGLTAGSVFESGNHSYSSVIVSILSGSGVFNHKGTMYKYGPGDQFDVHAGENHGFSIVRKDTIFTKTVLSNNSGMTH